jgi:diguanylate cyclase
MQAPRVSLAAHWAKGALLRLAAGRLEPTPENYARAYRAESGERPAAALPERALPFLDRLLVAAAPQAAPDLRQTVAGQLAAGHWERAGAALDVLCGPDATAAEATALASLIERIVRGCERGSRGWTSGRRKESLQRVLAGSRSDTHRLQQRLSQLVGSWESDAAGEAVSAPEPMAAADQAPAAAVADVEMQAIAGPPWASVVKSLADRLQAALASAEADGLPSELAAATQRIAADGPTPERVAEIERLCERAERTLRHREHLVDQLGNLCHELTGSLGDLAEDDSWAKGQLDAMRLALQDGLTARGVRSVSELLRHTRTQQLALRDERARAQDALKTLINRMLHELGELGSQTGRFHANVGRYAEVIEQADSLEGLTGVVREMVDETRSVHALVSQTQERLASEHARAGELSGRVAELEGELRRLSSEVSTDQLTQVANRRGLMQAFEIESARLEREGHALAVGLLDIDNFKRLNDELGHTVGDQALKTLAATVRESLRPGDHVARYGGEEFVVLLPATPVDEGQQILARLQRSLSGGLFMHEERRVFVTFSAGVTAYRAGEPIEQALERADEALYEAKRTGKNRTCVG